MSLQFAITGEKCCINMPVYRKNCPSCGCFFRDGYSFMACAAKLCVSVAAGLCANVQPRSENNAVHTKIRDVLQCCIIYVSLSEVFLKIQLQQFC